MRIIAIGDRPPAWVAAGVEEFRRRMPAGYRLGIEDLATARRGARGRDAMEDEGRRLLASLRRDEFVVALDEQGREFSTLELVAWLRERLQDGRDLAFLIGGPDGLAPAVHARCALRWSLSRLTFPHALVRVLLVEQLYRAHSVISGHPYHRE
jgi:23S rRNA (pseudouridine1915-N3)-methyltransferase